MILCMGVIIEMVTIGPMLTQKQKVFNNTVIRGVLPVKVDSYKTSDKRKGKLTDKTEDAHSKCFYKHQL